MVIEYRVYTITAQYPDKEIDNELGNFDFNNESYWFRLYFKCGA